MADTIPPVLTSLTFNKTAIDLSNGPVTIMATATATDAGGIAYVMVTWDDFPSGGFSNMYIGGGLGGNDSWADGQSSFTTQIEVQTPRGPPYQRCGGF